MPTRDFLSRMNLLVLLSKLDRNVRGEQTLCTVIKRDTENPKYPQTMREIWVTAVEDSEYFTDRGAGFLLPQDDPWKH